MNRDLVLAEWRRAGMALRAAQLLSAEDYPEDAASRAYYAILHAAKAVLFVHDIATASHAGTRRMFGFASGPHRTDRARVGLASRGKFGRSLGG